MWEKLIEVGTPLGLLPCGLASRDSTRTEAGLPLYGHELAGHYAVNPYEAGFGAYVKLHKPFFIGRDACVTAYTKPRREIARFQVNAAGTRPIHSSAAVIDRNGLYLGRVTSCVSLGEIQVGLALLEKLDVTPGTPITLLNPPRSEEARTVTTLEAGDRVAIPVPGTIISRFPEKAVLPKAGGE
jgi:glycine hydroxymethyltransferase